jgi:hypothetical protein
MALSGRGVGRSEVDFCKQRRGQKRRGGQQDGESYCRGLRRQESTTSSSKLEVSDECKDEKVDAMDEEAGAVHTELVSVL